MEGIMAEAKTPARIHAILPRKGNCGVVFRRGPSRKVAVIGWELDRDRFTVGQWFKGRIYEYRCNLSLDGTYLIYFAAKYGRVNPVDLRVYQLVKAEIGEFDWSKYSERNYESYRKLEFETEAKIRKKYASELEKIRRGRDYSDRSWTAISRTPYLKALDLWFNGSGWNGGGWFADNSHVWINQPPSGAGKHEHHIVSRKFKELAEPPDPRLVTENGGECPGIYFPRLERDGWKWLGENRNYAEFSKKMPYELTLVKRFYCCCGLTKERGVGVYYETHDVYRGDERLIDGAKWRWADYDSRHRRIVFARNGAIFAIYLKNINAEPIMLCDFNDMEYAEISAPY